MCQVSLSAKVHDWSADILGPSVASDASGQRQNLESRGHAGSDARGDACAITFHPMQPTRRGFDVGSLGSPLAELFEPLSRSGHESRHGAWRTFLRLFGLPVVRCSPVGVNLGTYKYSD